MHNSKRLEFALYVVFGILTTLVNFAAFYLFSIALGDNLYLVSNALAWIIAVVFAYATNKLVVFRATRGSKASLLRECAEFLAARVLSLGIEELGLLLLIGALGMGDLHFYFISGEMIAKVIISVIVVKLNYIFSKYIIFKKQ